MSKRASRMRANPAVSSSGSGDAGSIRRATRQLRISTAVAVLLLAGGIAGSMWQASAGAASDTERSQRTFAAASADIAATLKLAILREDDLNVSGAAYLSANPNSSNAEFLQWANSMRALPRYPELQDFGNAVIVPAADLAAFTARAEADPSVPLGPTGKFVVDPPGRRASYCFATVGQVRNAEVGTPQGYDFCATGLGPALFAARDSGQGSYAPFTVGKNLELGVSTPIYRGGVAPPNVAARRKAFLGWFGTSILPSVLLDRALDRHPHYAVTFRYHAGGSDAEFRSAAVPHGPRSASIDLHNGWTVTTYGGDAAGGLFSDGSAIRSLLAGIGSTAALAALIFVLGSGRARALRLVGEKTDELRHQALHDSLTGLANRALISDRIEQLLARNRRSHTMGSALYVDLDEFKNVNDTLGHEIGDRLLQTAAARLTTALRDADTIGRMGGDEFVVLIDGASLQSAPELVAERILEVMRQPFHIEGAASPIVITTSIGIAIGDRAEPEEMLRDADLALYEAKAQGRNCYVVFRPEMNTDARYRVQLEFDLRSALECGQFRLVYQPIYDLEDLALAGVEALIRWDHPALGTLSPDEFIPALESSGQIVEVGRWVLHEACAQLAAWRARGSDLSVAVNVSGRQLDRDGVVDDVRDALAASGLDPALLTIEVTETALMRNIDTTARRLRELKDIGVEVAIDDFGTGYSSIAYLQRFPVDCLKIDRSFTDAISESSEADVLIHTLVQLGKDLGMRTLAEGVETRTQLDHLRGEQVNQAQGFLLARPLDPDALESRLLAPMRRSESDRDSPGRVRS